MCPVLVVMWSGRCRHVMVMRSIMLQAAYKFREGPYAVAI